MMSMSLADRPRPALLQVRSILGGHLFSFVWLPREELTTSRRKSIALMLESRGRHRSDELVGRARRRRPRADPLHPIYRRRPAGARCRGARRGAGRNGQRLGAGGRGRADRASSAAPRATRLALTYLPIFPDSYRSRTSPEEARRRHPPAAATATTTTTARVRIWRSSTDTAGQLHLKIYRVGGLIPLSEAVPVLENFGFRVLEEMPTALTGGTLGYIHDFLLEIGERSRARFDHVARSARSRPRSPTCLCGIGRRRRVQPAGALRRARSAAGRLAARLVPLSAPDREQLRPGHRGRRAAPRAGRDRARWSACSPPPTIRARERGATSRSKSSRPISTSR